MIDKQMFPFEKNRYYAGKMLASADFRAEQFYMDNKRRFLSSALFGPGVICGLGAGSLDDLTVLVESGAALDGGGREIVLESPVVKKLSAIEGFEETKGEEIELRIRYTEESVHPVYAMGESDTGENYECNRIREGYELFLTERTDTEQETLSFLHEAVLMEQEDYRVSLCVPKTVCKGYLVKLTVKVKKRSGRERPLSFEGILQIPAFVAADGGHELSVGVREISLEQGEEYKKDYWALVADGRMDTGSILWKQGRGQAFVGEYDAPVKEDFLLKLDLCSRGPEEMALSQTVRENLEAVRPDGGEGVLLARIGLLRREGAYVIASVSDGREFIAPPAGTKARQQYMACFAKPPGEEERREYRPYSVKPSGSRRPAEETDRGDTREVAGMRDAGGDFRMPLMTSGTLEIPLDMNMKKGDICYSEEILHGLGPGAVFVQAGVACLEESIGMRSNVKSTIYGHSGLFSGQDHSPVETAVRVFHDKGSFQVAARLEGEQKSIVLLVNWVAMRFDPSEESRLAADHAEMDIVARVPTVRLEAGKSCYIEILFRKMEPCRLVYELTESGSGRISQDGIYTAPASRGLYEIHVYCADIPQIDTYVYAIVDK